MKNFKYILRYLIPYWSSAALSIGFNLLSTLSSVFSVTMLMPFLGILFGTQPLVTETQPWELSISSLTEHFNFLISTLITEKGASYALVYVSVLILSFTLLRNLFKYLSLYFMTPLRNGILRDIRNQLFNKITALPLSYFTSERKGDIMARTTNDVQEVETSIVSSLEMVFRDPITIVIYLFALFYTSPLLTAFILVLLPVAALILGRVGKTLKKTSLKGQTKFGELISVLEETIGGLRVIKAFSAEKHVGKRFWQMNEDLTHIMNRLIRRRALASPLSEFLGILIMVTIMYYGSLLVLNKEGDLAPQEFISYLAMFYLIIEPAKAFSQAWYNIQKGLASAERIKTVLDADIKIHEKPNAKPIKEFSESIEYRNVSFKYLREREGLILDHINITINKGKTIALVGQSGSGKSTLADLLPRFYDIMEGELLIDGIDIKDYKISDLRNLIGYVNQEPILFNDTFENNIIFNAQNATSADVEHAARVANAHDFIISTPEGYNTNVGDRGNKLSGGQRQRISIARAVLKNPPILILDEATSSLDTESERLVQDALYNLMQNRTTLVIAHRLSTVQHADEICVLHEGKIVERGRHDQLIALDGYYKKLHEMQMFA